MHSLTRTVVAFVLGLFMTPTLFAQGTVLFNNTPSTLVTTGVGAYISGAAGSYYFGLLASTSGADGTFTFTGNYATNAATAPGRFIGGTQVVNGWAPGTSMFYEVAGWSSNLGPTFQPGWLLGNFGGKVGNFGFSNVASGVAGGGSPPAPPFPLFGGTGIGSGFMLPPAIPEPSTTALIVVGTGVVLFYKTREKLKCPWSNLAPAPNRRPPFPLGGSGSFEHSCCAPPASPVAVGEARR